MAIAVLIAIDGKPFGSGFFAGAQGDAFAVVTALHTLGTGQDFRIGLPPHGGDMGRPQVYPLAGIEALPAQLALVEPLLDLAVLLVVAPSLRVPIPRYISKFNEMAVGDGVLIVGYPFAVLGSFLETVEPCSVSALGNRHLEDGTDRLELILSHQTHPGSSGSPVVRRSDGAVCGVVRGCLAPPGLLSIGNIPIGTDTSVTYATSAHVVPSLLNEAFKNRGMLG